MIKLSRAIFCAILFSLPFSSMAAAPTLENVQQLMNEGRIKLALRKVKSYQLSHPNDPQAEFLKGTILARLGEEGAAIATFEKLTQKFPELPEPFNNLAVLYAKKGKYREARGSLERAIMTHPAYSTAHENLGHIYTILAASAYNQALSLEDNNNPLLQSKLEMLHQLSTLPAPEAKPNTRSVAVATPPKPRIKTVPQTKPKPVAAPRQQSVAKLPPKPAVRRSVKPAAKTKPAARSGSSVSNKGQVQAVVNGWAKAWRNGNVNGYLRSYSKSFAPSNGMNRKAWERQRRQRVGGKRIQLDLANVKIDFTAPNVALVTFDQSYKSSTYADEVFKYLVVEREGRQWKIAQEQTIE